MFKKIATYWSLLVVAVMMAACGPVEQPEEPNPMENVPEGVLRLFADKTQIVANGEDAVQFTLMYGSENVTDAKNLQLIRTSDGEETYMPYRTTTFTSTAPGVYTFKAKIFRGGDIFTDNEVEVTVVPAVGDGEVKDYYQKLVGLQFTSVGCQNCPSLSYDLKEIQAEIPGRVSVLSLHQYFKMDDPMEHPLATAYHTYLGMSGLPNFNFNIIPDYEVHHTKSSIKSAVDYVLKNYPATCGVAIESSVEGGAAVVKAKITSNTATKYRYMIFLVEDGIEYSQLGVSGTYLHNNVVRAASSGEMFGDRFAAGAKLQVGVESLESRTMELGKEWKAENMRVVVVALSAYGDSYIVNNANECKLGDTADYLFN